MKRTRARGDELRRKVEAQRKRDERRAGACDLVESHDPPVAQDHGHARNPAALAG
jgi:hypothetical protein